LINNEGGAGMLGAKTAQEINTLMSIRDLGVFEAGAVKLTTKKDSIRTANSMVESARLS